MKIWAIPCRFLCQAHLLGEHSELHTMYSVITKGKRGWSTNPETKRWVGHLRALYNRHQEQVAEMVARGWNHISDLDESLAIDDGTPLPQLYTLLDELQHIKQKQTPGTKDYRKSCKCDYSSVERFIVEGEYGKRDGEISG